MSGIQMMLQGAGGGVVQNVSAVADSTASGSGSSTANVVFQSDGTMNGGVNYSGPSNWYMPASSGIGAQYWLSFDGAAFVSLATSRSTSLTGTNNSVSRNVRIALDSAGSTIVATGSIFLMVSNSQ